MTDAPLPTDDEIVSAHLDGAATAEEAARVAADPALRARAAELARVAAAVAAPVEVPAPTREAALAAALDAFDRTRAGETTTAGPAPAPMPVVPTAGPGPGPGPVAGAAPEAPATPGAPVTDLAAARARRRGRAVPYLAAAAAAVVLVVAGLGVALRSTTSTSTDTASVAAAPSTTARADSGATNQGAESNTEKSTSGAAGSPTTTARSGAPSTVAPSAPTAGSDPDEATGTFVGDLGTFTSPTQVRAELDRGGARSSAATGSGSGAVDAVDRVAAAPDIARCDAVVRAADPEIGPLRTSGTATYQGTDALVLVYGIDRQAHPAANGATRAVTVDRATCVVLDAQTF